LGILWKPYYTEQAVGSKWDMISDWQSGRAGYYPTGMKHMVEENS
jgi:hypothetical protein